MVSCPVCGKTLKTAFGLVGHLRLKNDIAHVQYNNQLLGKIENNQVGKQPIVNDNNSDIALMQREIRRLNTLIEQQNKQPIQPIQHVHYDQPVQPTILQPAQQPVQPVQPENESQKMLNQLKQDEIDQKADDELFEVLSEKMDGGITSDHAIMDSAPKRLRDRLWHEHLDLL